MCYELYHIATNTFLAFQECTEKHVYCIQVRCSIKRFILYLVLHLVVKEEDLGGDRVLSFMQNGLSMWVY